MKLSLKNLQPTAFWILFLFFVNYAEALTYPKIKPSNTIEKHFGITVNDKYRNLENLSSSSVEKWAKAENELTRSVLDQSKNRNAYLQRLLELTKKESTSVPVLYGNRWFYFRKPEGKNRFAIIWKATDSKIEKTAFDENELPENKNTLSYYFSNSGKTFGYISATKSNGKAEVSFRDVDTGQELDSLPCFTNTPIAISPDDSGFYYYNGNDLKIIFHRFGSNTSDDRAISLAENIPQRGYINSLAISADQKWILVTLVEWNNSQNTKAKVHLFVKKIESNSSFQLIYSESMLSEFSKFTFDEFNDVFYFFSRGSTPNGKIISLNMRSKNLVWHDYIPENKNLTLTDFSIYKGSLFLNYLNKSSSKILIKNLSSGITSVASLPNLGAATTPTPKFPYYTFETIFEPTKTYTVDSNDLQPVFYFSDNPGFDSRKFKIEQVFYPSADGTKISMFVVTRKDVLLDSNTPFIIEGYGGFSIPMLSNFNLSIIPWLEAGGGYALMNLRGGSEYGTSWHRAGVLDKKQNVFNDAIAAAQYLINNKYTQASKLAIKGGSNGGLLAGAVVTQRPDLFKAAVSENPVLDMIRFTKFGSGKDWISDYGNPEKQSDFKNLLSYSPYHNISVNKAYPAILFTGSYSDDIVTPIHAMKAAAAFQDVTKTTNPILLSLHKDQGHSVILVQDWIENAADIFGFLMDQMF